MRQRINAKKRSNISKKIIYILGDGQTEETYINRINDLGIFSEIRLRYVNGDELNFETFLKEHLEQNSFLILDIDNEQPLGSSCRYEKIKTIKEKFTDIVYYNNYSFETWLINHKAYFCKAFINKKQYNFYIKKIFGISHWSEDKSEQNRNTMMSQIDSIDVEFAKQNSKRIFDESNLFANPNSNMHLMFEKLEKIYSESID